MTEDPTTKVIFDTDCVLCSGVVHFILRHERDTAIQFVSAWSPTGLRLAAKHGFSRADLDRSYLLIEGGRALTRSDAAMATLAHLKAPWRWLRVLAIVPRPLRDAVYSFIASRRYRWFGHKDRCFIPPEGSRGRFVDA